MEDEKKVLGEEEVKEEGLVETLATEGGDGAEQSGAEEPKPSEKMVPQSKVNELVGRARQEGRESAMRELFDKYGVENAEELDEVFARGQQYDILNDTYESERGNFRSVAQENALLRSGADEDRWDDIKLILGGRGLDVTLENIEEYAKTHPEWLKVKPDVSDDGLKQITKRDAEAVAEKLLVKDAGDKKVAVLGKFGGSAAVPKRETIDEEEFGLSLFGV